MKEFMICMAVMWYVGFALSMHLNWGDEIPSAILAVGFSIAAAILSLKEKGK